MSNKFSALVRAKLTKLDWKQSELGRAIHRGPTYVSYLVRGKNPSTPGGKFCPAQSVVEDVARVLGIPLEEALAAAGYEMPPPPQEPNHESSLTSVTPSPASSLDAEARLFDVAYRAALAAVKADSGYEAPVKIDLADGVFLVLHGGDLTADETASFTGAIRTAWPRTLETGDRRRKDEG